MLTKIKGWFKTKKVLTVEKLVESYVFSAFGLEAVYFVNRGYEYISGVKTHINWATVGYIFLVGIGAPALRLLDARFPVLTKFSTKLLAVLGAKTAPTP